MFSIGVDLGQRRDFSAIAVVERLSAAAGPFDHIRWAEPQPAPRDEWVVRHLERMPLGTPYTAVAARIVDLARNPRLASRCRLVVDATGVGMPVVDMLRASGPGCAIDPVWITGGHSERFDGKVWHVPKLELLARLQTLLETRRLRMMRRMREAGTLVRELSNVKSAARPSGRLKVGAEGSGEHDDLVLAVALAVWRGRMPGAGEQPRRLL
ncbi:MAG: hypothetical protein WBY44_01320 [Bryobacteraceae bacterium]